MLFVRAFILLLFFCSAVIYAAPVINEQYSNYKITGDTADGLRHQMSTLGPSDIAAEHFDASTRWYIQWQYSYQPDANGCYLTKVNVKVDIIYHFPEWADYVSANDGLRSHWDTYMRNLKTHERGHAENGREAATAIEHALMELPAMQRCEDLTNTADNIAYQTIARHNTKDINYENETNHGVTQGATFP
jgi:predicted secreted Zn-dependent protease